MISPREFEHAYLRRESQLIGWFSRKNHLVLMLLSVLVLGLLYYGIARISSSVTKPVIVGTYFIYYTNRFSVFALLALGLLNYFFSTDRYRKIFIFSCLSLLWVVKCYCSDAIPTSAVPLVLIYTFVPLFCGTLFVLDEYFNATSRKAQYGFLGFYFMYYILLGFALAHFKLDSTVEFLWSFKFQYLLITLLAALYFNSHFDLSAMVLNPVNACFGVFWPLHTTLVSNDSIEKTNLWWHGVLDLSLCAALLLTRYSFENLFQEDHGSWISSFGVYVLVLMAEVAGFNFVSGGSRLFGFKVGDATNFLFLAKNPAETWQRGSVFSYQFIQRFIFFPLIRFTQSRLLLILACFGFFYVVKYGYQPGLDFFVQAVGGQPLHDYFPEPFNFYKKCIWFVLIYFTRKNWIFMQSNLNQKGVKPWLAILATHLTIFALPQLIFKLFFSLRQLAL